jgi:hypothetical protein
MVGYRDPFYICNRKNVQVMEWEQTRKFISVGYKVKLDERGRGELVFEITPFKMFSIAVENKSEEDVTGWLEISPNTRSYKQDSEVLIITKNGLEVFVANLFLRYVRLQLRGQEGASVTVYLQGQYEGD